MLTPTYLVQKLITYTTNIHNLSKNYWPTSFSLLWGNISIRVWLVSYRQYWRRWDFQTTVKDYHTNTLSPFRGSDYSSSYLVMHFLNNPFVLIYWCRYIQPLIQQTRFQWILDSTDTVCLWTSGSNHSKCPLLQKLVC